MGKVHILRGILVRCKLEVHVCVNGRIAAGDVDDCAQILVELDKWRIVDLQCVSTE